MTASGGSLAGIHILLARTGDGGSEFVDGLEDEGASVTLIRLQRVEPPVDLSPVTEAASRLSEFDWLVVTSANAVRALVAAAQYGKNLSLEPPRNIAAVGPATNRALSAAGMKATLVPIRNDADNLVEAMREFAPGSVFLPQAHIADDTAERGLSEAGFRVTRVTAYRTVVDEAECARAAELIHAANVDLVVLASPSAVRTLVEDLGSSDQIPLAVCIGPRPAQACRQAGLHVGAVADAPTPESVAQAAVRAAELIRGE